MFSTFLPHRPATHPTLFSHNRRRPTPGKVLTDCLVSVRHLSRDLGRINSTLRRKRKKRSVNYGTGMTEQPETWARMGTGLGGGVQGGIKTEILAIARMSLACAYLYSTVVNCEIRF